LKQLWASAREPTSELRIPAEFLFSQRDTKQKQRRNITGEREVKGEHEASEQGCSAVATVARTTKRLW
jgi:hypothetical protein